MTRGLDGTEHSFNTGTFILNFYVVLSLRFQPVTCLEIKKTRGLKFFLLFRRTHDKYKHNGSKHTYYFYLAENVMNLTNHASCRMSQRAISEDILEIVLAHGTFKRAQGGAEKIFFGKKQSQAVISDLKRKIRMYERAENTNVIITPDGQIITTYKSK
jgi:hypothetical protein